MIPNNVGAPFEIHAVLFGKVTGYVIDATGIEPQPGFGGFKAIKNQTVNPYLFATGNAPARASTDGSERAGSTTTMQLAPVFVPMNVTVTGIQLFNGAVPAGSIKVALFDSAGLMVGGATNANAGAGLAQAGGDAYQNFPFRAPVSLRGPAMYWVATVSSSTSPINCHTFGNFPAGEVAAVYATAFETTNLAVTLPTTFTSARGPIASLYQ